MVSDRYERPGKRLSGLSILAGLVAAMCSLPSTAHGEEALRVVVHEAAKIPGPQLAGALVMAADLFKAVDVRLEWHKPSEAGVRWPTVVVASSESFDRGAFSPVDTLGRVVQRGVRAYVLYDRVAELARQYRMDPAILLSRVIAHEVGHLLFGEQHVPAGLMAGTIGPGSSYEEPFPPNQKLDLRTAFEFGIVARLESPVCDQ